MNKKLLLVAGVLTIISSSAMAQPVERVLSSKNTDTDFDQKTNSVYVSLKDDIRDIYRIQFEKKDDKYFGISSNKITAELINMEYKYYDNAGCHYTNFSANGTFSNLNNTEDGLSAFSSLSAGNFNVYRNWGDSISLKDNGFSVYNYDKNSKEYGTILKSTGLDNGGFKIINVAKGTNDTDAVNVSQLKETNKKVDDNTKVIENHENRIGDLEHKTVDVGRNALERANHYTDLQVNKGVAKASALAGLKFLDYNPKDKWSFAASVGHYRNANAVAVGAAYQPNENTMIHGGITVDGKVAYNLGVSVKVGGQKYINKYELAEQVRQLQSDNAELRQELAELRSMIEKR